MGRSLDLSDTGNRAIVSLTGAAALAGAAWQIAQGAPLGAAALWGVQTGLAVFLAWALGRELDPDHPKSALAAAALTLLPLVFWPLPNLLSLMWLLLWVRALNRTVGPAPTGWDGAALLGLTAWVAWTVHWAAALLAALAAYRDYVLSGRPAALRGRALIPLLILVVAFGTQGRAEAVRFDGVWLGGTLGVGLAFVVAAARRPPRRATADATGQLLVPARALAGQGFAAVAGLLFALLQGEAGVRVWSPLWAAMAAAAVALWLDRARGTRRDGEGPPG